MTKRSELISIEIFNEGVETWIPVQAARLDDGNFLITQQHDFNPPSEDWEFEPGDIVKCLPGQNRFHFTGESLILPTAVARLNKPVAWVKNSSLTHHRRFEIKQPVGVDANLRITQNGRLIENIIFPTGTTPSPVSKAITWCLEYYDEPAVLWQRL